jgi:hypothetical protein
MIAAVIALSITFGFSLGFLAGLAVTSSRPAPAALKDT